MSANYLFAGESPQGGAGEVTFVAHLRHAAEHEATKAHRLHALGASAKDVTARARGRIAQRGGGGAVGAPMRRRGRRPMEAPGSAAPNRAETAPPPPRTAVSGHAPRAAPGPGGSRSGEAGPPPVPPWSRW